MRTEKTLTIDEYGATLARQGTTIVRGSQRNIWTEYERYALERTPIFDMAPPPCGEINRVLWQGRAVVANFLVVPGAQAPPNTWLYQCADPTYGIEKLAPAVRRNVRRGLRDFSTQLLDPTDVLTHGMQAFCDTRRRNGLTDGTPEEFQRRFNSRVSCPAHIFWGAWKDGTLAGFASMTEVDDWLTIEGCFAQDAHLNSRPNDVLVFTLLHRYLVVERRRIVSYGLSSVQPVHAGGGLHAFKTKMGFQAEPAHRTFALHPVLRPFANRVSLWGLQMALRFKHGNRRLSKAYGMLAVVLGTVSGARSDRVRQWYA